MAAAFHEDEVGAQENRALPSQQRPAIVVLCGFKLASRGRQGAPADLPLTARVARRGWFWFHFVRSATSSGVRSSGFVCLCVYPEKYSNPLKHVSTTVKIRGLRLPLPLDCVRRPKGFRTLARPRRGQQLSGALPSSSPAL